MRESSHAYYGIRNYVIRSASPISAFSRRGTFGICATYHIRVFAHHSQVHYLSHWCSLLQTSSILYSTTVVTRDTFPVFSVTSGAATHTITATAFYACFRNRCSEPRVSPASMCVPRVGFAPLCVLPPRFLTTRGFLSHLPHSRWQHCIAPTVMHHPRWQYCIAHT